MKNEEGRTYGKIRESLPVRAPLRLQPAIAADSLQPWVSVEPPRREVASGT